MFSSGWIGSSLFAALAFAGGVFADSAFSFLLLFFFGAGSFGSLIVCSGVFSPGSPGSSAASAFFSLLAIRHQERGVFIKIYVGLREIFFGLFLLQQLLCQLRRDAEDFLIVHVLFRIKNYFLEELLTSRFETTGANFRRALLGDDFIDGL